jgi:hypothetical protein
MKTKSFIASLFVVFSLGSLTAFGEIATDRVGEAARELDEIVKKVDIKTLAPTAAGLLKMESGLIERIMIQQKATLSALVCVKLIAGKTGATRQSDRVQSKPRLESCSQAGGGIGLGYSGRD